MFILYSHTEPMMLTGKKGNKLSFSLIVLIIGVIIIVISLISIILFSRFGDQKNTFPINSRVFKITDEIYEIQIRKVEDQFKPTNLRGKNSGLRNEFAWLLALWFARDKTFDVFGKDVLISASKLYQAIQWIENEKDERRKDNEEKVAWTDARQAIRVDLSQDELFNHPFSYNVYQEGDMYTPLTYLRKTLVHEFVHFIGGRKYEKPISFSFIKADLKKKYPNLIFNYVEGFKVNVDPTPDNTKDKNREPLRDFNEAATELISTYWQKSSGWNITPHYADPNVQTSIKLLEKTLGKTNISIVELAKFSANSDLDGLAKRLAEKTKEYTYETEDDKIRVGLWVIGNIENGDLKDLEDYWQQVERSKT